MRTCLLLLKFWVTLTHRTEKGQHDTHCQWVPTGISKQHIHVAGRKLPEWLGLLEVDYQGEGQAKSVAYNCNNFNIYIIDIFQ